MSKDVDVKNEVVRGSVSNIKYDLDGFLDCFHDYVEIGVTKEDVLQSLPTEGMVEISEDDKDYSEWRIQKDIECDTGWLVIGFDYEMNGKNFHYEEPPLKEQMSDFEHLKESVKNYRQEQLLENEVNVSNE